jgi:hypothetical protein
MYTAYNYCNTEYFKSFLATSELSTPLNLVEVILLKLYVCTSDFIETEVILLSLMGYKFSVTTYCIVNFNTITVL